MNIDELIIKTEQITENVHAQGRYHDYDLELGISEAVGRLTLSKAEAIEILENFIENHSEYLNK